MLVGYLVGAVGVVFDSALAGAALQNIFLFVYIYKKIKRKLRKY